MYNLAIVYFWLVYHSNDPHTSGWIWLKCKYCFDKATLKFQMKSNSWQLRTGKSVILNWNFLSDSFSLLCFGKFQKISIDCVIIPSMIPLKNFLEIYVNSYHSLFPQTDEHDLIDGWHVYFAVKAMMKNLRTQFLETTERSRVVAPQSPRRWHRQQLVQRRFTDQTKLLILNSKHRFLVTTEEDDRWRNPTSCTHESIRGIEWRNFELWWGWV